MSFDHKQYWEQKQEASPFALSTGEFLLMVWKSNFVAKGQQKDETN